MHAQQINWHNIYICTFTETGGRALRTITAHLVAYICMNADAHLGKEWLKEQKKYA